ncbi:hypothetical protein FOZ60_015383 [Perkinsus olseni]|uniref:Uncharacterized protein n=1 Tax=Perkinsus olseni TaxID=32597 RepID=A0A7J6N6W9_PEROL|nr:hypothetical protein FOZ60_015383 [Perkinsus olseni]
MRLFRLCCCSALLVLAKQSIASKDVPAEILEVSKWYLISEAEPLVDDKNSSIGEKAAEGNAFPLVRLLAPILSTNDGENEESRPSFRGGHAVQIDWLELQDWASPMSTSDGE